MDSLVSIALVKRTESINSIGEPVITETSSTIWGNIRSATTAEWDAAQKHDFNTEYVVTIYQREYSGEKVAILNGTRYSIFRDYMTNGDRIELKLEKQEGTEVEPK